MGFSSYIRRFFNKHDTERFAGIWSLVRVEAPHPIKRYDLTLAQDGGCGYDSEVSLKQGDLTVSGSGRWWADGSEIHFTLGEYRGVARASLDGDELMLDQIPGMKVAEGTPCTFHRCERKV